MSIPYHPQTKINLELLKHNLSHAVVVVGVHGSGKLQAIKEVISQLEPDQATKIKHGNFERLLIIEPVTLSIGIEQIKELEVLLQLRDNQKRYVIIPRAELLTTEAQNAFLKTFEEASDNVHVFLHVQQQQQLLSTILSRAQTVRFLTPSKSKQAEWLQETFSLNEQAAIRLYYLSDGRPDIALSLAESEEKHLQAQVAMDFAKQIITESILKRLQLLKSIEKDKNRLQELLGNCIVVCRAALRSSALSSSNDKANIWCSKLQTVLMLQKYLYHNVNTRLIIDKLVLEL